LQTLQTIPRIRILKLAVEFHISYVRGMLTKDLTGPGSKICDRKLIVVAIAKQMYYSTAIERRGSVAKLRGSGYVASLSWE